jgi:hypothetical protein
MQKVELYYYLTSSKFFSKGHLSYPDTTTPDAIMEHIEQLIELKSLPGLIVGHASFHIVVMIETPWLGEVRPGLILIPPQVRTGESNGM